VHRRDPRTLALAFALVLAPLSILPVDDAAAVTGSVRPGSTAYDDPQVVEPGTVLKLRSPRPASQRSTGTRPCRSGSIALTFDDGPSPVMTPRLLEILVRENVPATFFMVGQNARRTPRTVLRVKKAGFTIANHTWSHRELTRLTTAQVRGQLLRAGAELRRQGIDTGTLMRPPYGAINSRVSRAVRGLGLVPVLWTADSMDWSGGTAAQIADRILAQLRPYRKNVVLQHDGVDNSAASIAAVPIVIRVARARGYCFAGLARDGGVAPVGTTRRPPAAPKPAPTATPAARPAPSTPERRDPAPDKSSLLELIAQVGPVRPWMILPLWVVVQPLALTLP
jgi:peptidoglycan/xylan/chitin deacetylase (PgdA/CDA1 family)